MGLSLRNIGKKIENLGQGVVAQVNPFDNNRTFQNAQGNAPIQQQQHIPAPSLLQQATHNGLTNTIGGALKTTAQLPLQFSENYSNTFANLGNKLSGIGNQSIQTNVGGSPVLNKTLQLSGATGQNKQLAGDVAQVGLSALPGVGKGASVLTKVGTGAALGAGFNAASTAGNGGTSGQVVKSALIGGALGAALPAAGIAAKPVVRAVAREARPIVLQATSLTPRTTLNEQLTLQDLSNHLSDAKPLKPAALGQTIAKSREIAQKHGVDITSGSQLDRLNSVNSVLDNLQSKGRLQNQSGKVAPLGGDARVTPDEAFQYSHAFNVPIDQARAELAALKQRDSQEAARQIAQPKTGVGLSSEVKQQLNPKPAKFSRPVEENTTLNPKQVSIPEVNAGDYEKARSNAQLASEPINVATRQSIEATKKLTPEEKLNFWHTVENPELAVSPAQKEAVARFNELTNTTHATSQALGGNTNYVQNYARHNWDLSDPEMAAKYEELVKARGGKAVDPFGFSGIDNQNRAFKTIAEGKAAGFNLKNAATPEKDILDYGKSTSNALKKQALIKGVTEADSSQTLKNRAFDLKNGNTLPVSEQGLRELQTYDKAQSQNPVLGGYRKVNKNLKQTLLSLSQFHTININALQAAPTLAGTPKDWITGEGHPVKALQGLFGSARALADKGYADSAIQKALKSGTIEDSTRIGTPILHGNDFSATGGLKLGKSGFGEKAVFERQLPVMHIKMVEAVVQDLKNRGISLDSVEARKAGTEINQIMGYVNTELRNFNPKVQRGLSDVALAPQFTRAKWETLKDALTTGGVQGNLARRAVIGKYTTEAALILGIGAVLQQKSDSLKDTLYRALIHPSVPTPFKDSKGNNIELGLPANYASEAAGLVGNITRNNNGRITPDLNPENVGGNLANYGRSRLAVLPSTALKVATNTNYANKPLYDPNAPAGTKAEQAATTVTQGLLPIGLQGIPQIGAVKRRLPGNVQDIITANTPGSNPLVKSAASSLGLTPRTDKTVGKGLTASQYFESLGNAKQGLNSRERAALELYAGNKKNPVTGKYDVQPNANDTATKATALLDNPKVISNLISMNTRLSAQGQKIDPLWGYSKDEITKVLQYQAMPPGGPDRTHWLTQNQSWYNPLADKRTAFFDSLPDADPNKPSAPIEYPAASKDIAAKQEKFFSIDDSGERAKYLQDNPDIQTQLDKQSEYTNKIREARGYGALDTFPTATPQVQKIIDTYNAIPKGGGKKGGNKYRSDWITAHPNDYAQMSQYFTQASLYGAQKELAQSQFKDTGVSQKGLKDLYSLGQYDVQKQTDANGNTFYALGGSSGGNSGFGSGNSTTASFSNPYKYAISRNAGGTVASPKVTAKKAKVSLRKPSKGNSVGKAKVSIKKSLV